MGAQFGRDLLIKVGDGGGPETFETVAGLRTKSLTINAGEPVDVSDADSPNQWRELLAGSSLKSISFSGDGVFKDSASEEAIRSKTIPTQEVANYQIVLPDFGTLEGPFIITQLEYSGEHENAITFSAQFESAGEITWTAA